LNKTKAILVDLDGTLCNIEHRRHFVDGTDEKKDWRSFNESMIIDTPNLWCVELVISMAKRGFTIIFVSGRSDEYRSLTFDWIEKNTSIFRYTDIPIRLFMRKRKDYREDSVIKEEIYLNKIKPEFDVLFCVDDRTRVVNKWRELGLTCLQCDEGNF